MGDLVSREWLTPKAAALLERLRLVPVLGIPDGLYTYAYELDRKGYATARVRHKRVRDEKHKRRIEYLLVLRLKGDA